MNASPVVPLWCETAPLRPRGRLFRFSPLFLPLFTSAHAASFLSSPGPESPAEVVQAPGAAPSSAPAAGSPSSRSGQSVDEAAPAPPSPPFTASAPSSPPFTKADLILHRENLLADFFYEPLPPPKDPSKQVPTTPRTPEPSAEIYTTRTLWHVLLETLHLRAERLLVFSQEESCAQAQGSSCAQAEEREDRQGGPAGDKDPAREGGVPSEERDNVLEEHDVQATAPHSRQQHEGHSKDLVAAKASSISSSETRRRATFSSSVPGEDAVSPQDDVISPPQARSTAPSAVLSVQRKSAPLGFVRVLDFREIVDSPAQTTPSGRDQHFRSLTYDKAVHDTSSLEFSLPGLLAALDALTDPAENKSASPKTFALTYANPYRFFVSAFNKLVRTLETVGVLTFYGLRLLTTLTQPSMSIDPFYTSRVLENPTTQKADGHLLFPREITVRRFESGKADAWVDHYVKPDGELGMGPAFYLQLEDIVPEEDRYVITGEWYVPESAVGGRGDATTGPDRTRRSGPAPPGPAGAEADAGVIGPAGAEADAGVTGPAGAEADVAGVIEKVRVIVSSRTQSFVHRSVSSAPNDGE